MNKESTRSLLLCEANTEEHDHESAHDEEPIKEPSRGCRLNKHMLSTKAVYFTSSAARSSCYPFIAVFLTTAGFTATQIGILIALTVFAGIAGNCVLPAIADKTRRQGLILFIACLLFTLAIFPLPWVLKSMENEAKQMLCLSSPYKTNCYSSKLYGAMTSLYFSGSFFGYPMSSFIDTRTNQLISACPVETSYGEQRVYGAIGYGLGPVVAGLLVDQIHEPSMSEYTPIFYMFLLFMICCMISIFFQFSQPTKKIENICSDKTAEPKHWKLVCTVTCQPKAIFFLISVILMGIANAIGSYFFYLFLKDEFNASKYVMGMSTFAECSSELLIFRFASRIIDWVGGVDHAIGISFVAYFARFLLTSYITNIWLLVVVEMSHGIGFALFWSAANEIVHSLGQKEISNTIFGIMHASLDTGRLLANLFSGYIYTVYGGRLLYRGSSILYLLWGIIISGKILFQRTQ